MSKTNTTDKTGKIDKTDKANMMSKTNKILIAVFCAVIALSAALSLIMLLSGPAVADAPSVTGAADASGDAGPGADSGAEEASPPVPGLTVVKAPDQTKAERPSAFPDPADAWIKLPDGTNLAEGKPVRSGEVTEVYAAVNVVDGNTSTYWESKGYPGVVTIDLQSSYNIQTVGVRLNPAPLWEPRKQTFEILVSADGENFDVAVPETLYEFDSDTGNLVRVDFGPIAAQYVRLSFTANTAGRTNGAQAAEIVVYE
jgi:hypothetical protein